ncbi:hypothetical protein K8R42_00375 [bacterium]|nr:hypothetical protein [bacterium]
MKHLLVLNSGSSSLKFSVFEIKKQLGKEVLSGSVSLYGNRSVLVYRRQKINFSSGHNLKNWWSYIHDLLAQYNITYVGLRMVHGGEEFVKTTQVSQQFLNKIKKYNKLAPLHNPTTLELIKLVKSTWPRVKMSVSFDTAWHKDLKPEVYLYSLPLKYYQQNKIRKYGFHGLSHQSATEYAGKVLHKKLNKLNIITCHLGSESSLAWYMGGKVKDTTMGFSPNEGITMSTRSGDLPASIVLYLAQELKMPLTKIKVLLNEKSGLLGLAGMKDLREVLLAAGYRVAGYKSSLKFSKEQKQAAKLALEIYIYDIKRYLASYLAMSKKLDAVVFTGAVGANSNIRNLIIRGLTKPNNCKVLVAPEAENKNLAIKTLKCLSK